MTHKHTILVVEDEPTLRLAISTFFSRAGYIVEEAADGKKAMAMIERRPPCLVFLDIILPKVNGFEVMEWMRGRKETADLPVVVLSQLGEREHVQKMKDFKVNYYFVKAEHSLNEVMASAKKSFKKNCKSPKGKK